MVIKVKYTYLLAWTIFNDYFKNPGLFDGFIF